MLMEIGLTLQDKNPRDEREERATIKPWDHDGSMTADLALMNQYLTATRGVV